MVEIERACISMSINASNLVVSHYIYGRFLSGVFAGVLLPPSLQILNYLPAKHFTTFPTLLYDLAGNIFRAGSLEPAQSVIDINYNYNDITPSSWISQKRRTSCVKCWCIICLGACSETGTGPKVTNITKRVSRI